MQTHHSSPVSLAAHGARIRAANIRKTSSLRLHTERTHEKVAFKARQHGCEEKDFAERNNSKS